MEVKDIIRQRRIELNLTMKEVADAVGVNEGTISRWESGEIANMRRDKILALANALDLSPAIIMEWDVTDQPTSNPAMQPDEQALINGYNQLNTSGKKQLHKQLEMMLNDDDYRKDTGSCAEEAM